MQLWFMLLFHYSGLADIMRRESKVLGKGIKITFCKIQYGMELCIHMMHAKHNWLLL